MSQLHTNQKQRMVFFLGPFLQLKRRKGTIVTTTGVHLKGNADDIYSEDVRKLCRQGRLKEALHILHVIDKPLDSSAYACLLQVCIKKKAFSEGKLVHIHMKERGLPQDRVLQNTLVNMYAKCGSLVDAHRVFDEMPKRDVRSWSVLIAAYSRHGFAEEALTLFHQMQKTEIQPNEFTFASVLPACANLASLDKGMEIHDEIIRTGFQSDLVVENALLDMYAKCGSIEKARHVFDKMRQRSVVSWTAMIAGYVQNGQGAEALRLFEQMQVAGVKPDSKTFASVVLACANLAALQQGIKIHEEIVRGGFQYDIFVQNALVDMYAKCGNIGKARNLFYEMPKRDVFSWTVMIAAYSRHGLAREALALFHEMKLTDIQPNQFTYASVLSACANLAVLEQGIEIHEEIIRSRFQFDFFVKNALVDMYAKCGSIKKARELFEKMPQRDAVSWNTMIAGYAQNGDVDEALRLFQKMPGPDVVSWTAMIVGYTQNGHVEEALKLFQEMPERNVVTWTAMIAGYAQNGQGVEALKLFRQMQLEGVKPNKKTFASVLPACANVAALEQGLEIHEDIIRSGFQSDVFVESALVDMYAKCGNIEKARDLFDKMHQRNTISWTAMIAGYAMHGCGEEALQLFEQMQQSGVNPDHVTLVCVLSACCHAGLVDKGCQFFDCMSEYYHITPAMEHYGCMVDLLGRAGHLDEAQNFINRMPIKPDATVWMCLLGACRVHSNIELGEHVAELLFELDPKNAAPYVLLSNIYAAASRWDGIENVRRMMKDKGVKKMPGCSWIEVNKQVHAFLTGGRSVPNTKYLFQVGEIV
eukprot:Gb_11039 [translate_table: standard]